MGTTKLAKNLSCPCGSGLKYKHCCWENDKTGEGWMNRPVYEEERKEGETGRLGFSDAMVAYAEPLLEKAGKNEEGVQKALMLAAVFWNIAQLNPPSRDRELRDIAGKLSSDKKDNAAFLEIADFMLHRYERMFGKKSGPPRCPDCGGPLEECPPADRTSLPPRWARILFYPLVIISFIFFSLWRALKKIGQFFAARKTSS